MSPRQRRVGWVALLGVVLLGTLGLVAWDASQGRTSVPRVEQVDPWDAVTRRDFVRAVAHLKEGTPEAEVVRLLGPPHDVRTDADPGGIGTPDTREEWRYGTDGHLTLATLGSVAIDTRGRVQYAVGGKGVPPDPWELTEAELRPLLRLIDKVSSYNAGPDYDPLATIRAVNALQPLGKDKALAALDEYLRVGSNPDGVFLVLRVLFDVPDDPGHLPVLSVGAPAPPAPADPRRLPRYPVLLQDDVPLLLVSGYRLAGVAQRPKRHVDYFRGNGRLRANQMRPPDDPLGVLDGWQQAAGWQYDGRDVSRGKLLIGHQLLNLIATVYRPATDALGDRVLAADSFDADWRTIRADVAKRAIRWDAGGGRYAYADGSVLPAPTRRQYRRHTWRIEGLGGQASVVVERANDKCVYVTLEWSGLGEQQVPYDLRVVSAKDQTTVYGRLTPLPLEANAGGNAPLMHGVRLAIADGEAVRLRMRAIERELVSPAYTP